MKIKILSSTLLLSLLITSINAAAPQDSIGTILTDYNSYVNSGGTDFQYIDTIIRNNNYSTDSTRAVDYKVSLAEGYQNDAEIYETTVSNYNSINTSYNDWSYSCSGSSCSFYTTSSYDPNRISSRSISEIQNSSDSSLEAYEEIAEVYAEDYRDVRITEHELYYFLSDNNLDSALEENKRTELETDPVHGNYMGSIDTQVDSSYVETLLDKTTTISEGLKGYEETIEHLEDKVVELTTNLVSLNNIKTQLELDIISAQRKVSSYQSMPDTVTAVWQVVEQQGENCSTTCSGEGEDEVCSTSCSPNMVTVTKTKDFPNEAKTNGLADASSYLSDLNETLNKVNTGITDTTEAKGSSEGYVIALEKERFDREMAQIYTEKSLLIATTLYNYDQQRHLISSFFDEEEALAILNGTCENDVQNLSLVTSSEYAFACFAEAEYRALHEALYDTSNLTRILNLEQRYDTGGGYRSEIYSTFPIPTAVLTNNEELFVSEFYNVYKFGTDMTLIKYLETYKTGTTLEMSLNGESFDDIEYGTNNFFTVSNELNTLTENTDNDVFETILSEVSGGEFNLKENSLGLSNLLINTISDINSDYNNINISSQSDIDSYLSANDPKYLEGIMLNGTYGSSSTLNAAINKLEETFANIENITPANPYFDDLYSNNRDIDDAGELEYSEDGDYEGTGETFEEGNGEIDESSGEVPSGTGLTENVAEESGSDEEIVFSPNEPNTDYVSNPASEIGDWNPSTPISTSNPIVENYPNNITQSVDFLYGDNSSELRTNEDMKLEVDPTLNVTMLPPYQGSSVSVYVPYKNPINYDPNILLDNYSNINRVSTPDLEAPVPVNTVVSFGNTDMGRRTPRSTNSGDINLNYVTPQNVNITQ